MRALFEVIFPCQYCFLLSDGSMVFILFISCHLLLIKCRIRNRKRINVLVLILPFYSVRLLTPSTPSLITLQNPDFV